MSFTIPFDAPIEHETAGSYRAYALYRDMGAERTLTAVGQRFYDQLTIGKQRVIEKWSSRFRWVDRALAHDAHQDKLRKNAEEEALAQTARERVLTLERERQRQVDRELELRDRLFDRADVLLKLPVHNRTEKGNTVYMAPRFTQKTIADLVNVASLIGRRALGMTSDRTAQGDQEAEDAAANLAERLARLSPDELERLIETVSDDGETEPETEVGEGG